MSTINNYKLKHSRDSTIYLRVLAAVPPLGKVARLSKVTVSGLKGTSYNISSKMAPS